MEGMDVMRPFFFLGKDTIGIHGQALCVSMNCISCRITMHSEIERESANELLQRKQPVLFCFLLSQYIISYVSLCEY
jgi:hypothetical protein